MKKAACALKNFLREQTASVKFYMIFIVQRFFFSVRVWSIAKNPVLHLWFRYSEITFPKFPNHNFSASLNAVFLSKTDLEHTFVCSKRAASFLSTQPVMCWQKRCTCYCQFLSRIFSFFKEVLNIFCWHGIRGNWLAIFLLAWYNSGKKCIH